jgi:hypothetical protein
MVILGAAFALWEPAAAEPRAEIGRAHLERQLAELKRQARELEEQIRRLEAQLAPPVPLASTASLPVATAKPSGPADCEMPFYMDSSGLKRVRSECVETNRETSCEMPFMLDDSGIRRVRPGCGSAEPPVGRASFD